jgi:hypothetical protein
MKREDYFADKPSETLGKKEELELKGETVRSLGDLGLFAGEIFENDFRRVDDALSLLNGTQNEFDLEVARPAPTLKAPVLQ